MKDEINRGLTESDESDMEGIEIIDLEDFDVDGIKITMDMPDLGVGTTVVIVVDGSHVFQIMVMDADLESSGTLANNVVQSILETDVETKEVTFNDDGTSNGGAFDRMPTAGDELAGDLS